MNAFVAAVVVAIVVAVGASLVLEGQFQQGRAMPFPGPASA